MADESKSEEKKQGKASKGEKAEAKAAEPSKLDAKHDLSAYYEKVKIRKSLVNMTCHDGTHLEIGQPCELSRHEYERLKKEGRKLWEE